MTQGPNQATIGISIRDTALRMTEALRTNGERRITRLSQGRVRVPFHFSSFKDNTLIRKYAEDINRLYETADFQARGAVFSLDSNMVLIKKIPVDASLKGDRLKDHVHWEVEQCVINSLDEYIIDFEHVPPTGDQEFAEVIIVVVRRIIVKFLQEIFKSTDLRLRAIDVDVFSAHRVFMSNYDLVGDVYTALIDVRKENIQFSIIRDAVFLLAEDVDYPLEEQNVLPGSEDDFLPRILSKELRRLILDNRLGKDIEEMNAIYIYGDSVTNEIVETLQNTHNVRIDRANPFRRLAMPEQVGDPTVHTNPEAFVVSVGAALKGLQ